MKGQVKKAAPKKNAAAKKNAKPVLATGKAKSFIDVIESTLHDNIREVNKLVKEGTISYTEFNRLTIENTKCMIGLMQLSEMKEMNDNLKNIGEALWAIAPH